MKLFNNPAIVLILILIALALTLLISMLVFFFFFKRRTNLGIKGKIYSVLIGLAVTATISSIVIFIGVKSFSGGLKPYDRTEQEQCFIHFTDDRSVWVVYSHSKNYDIGHLEVIDIENQKLIYELEVRAKVVNYSDFTETGEGIWESSWCYLSLDNDGKILIRQK